MTECLAFIRDYLAVVLDLFSRHPAKNAGLVFHNDRDIEDGSEAFPTVLGGYGIDSAMNPKGNCRDNACSETLFGSLKIERLPGIEVEPRRCAKDEVMDWPTWYNGRSLHLTLD